MAVTRQPPAANDFSVTLTINKGVVPYYQDFYNAFKQEGESPEDFIERNLKEQVINYHLNVANNELGADANTFREEIRTDVV
jgi:hypothetical protein